MESSNPNKPKAKSESQKAKSQQPIANSQKPKAKNLCIIPARGGSKRIPRKNIKDFLGKPIIAYSIEVALESGLFDEVMVSTDDEEITQVAKHYRARVPFLRSGKASDDFATTLDVVKEVLASYKKRGKEFENICILYPTAPFVTTKRIKEGFDKLGSYQACVPVVAFDYPVWRAFKLKDETLSYQWPEYETSRSQDLEPLYHDAGQWYWIKTRAIKDSLVPDKTASVLLDSLEVQDIDEEADWKLAELKFKVLNND